MRFAKAHGLGNDFILVEAAEAKLVATADSGPERYGMTGARRAMAYHMTVATASAPAGGAD